MPVSPEIECVIVTGGYTKTGEAESLRELCIRRGEILALVGPTGSGKSLLLADIEQVAAATRLPQTVIIKGPG